jgi:hypothetical protein
MKKLLETYEFQEFFHIFIVKASALMTLII